MATDRDSRDYIDREVRQNETQQQAVKHRTFNGEWIQVVHTERGEHTDRQTNGNKGTTIHKYSQVQGHAFDMDVWLYRYIQKGIIRQANRKRNYKDKKSLLGQVGKYADKNAKFDG